MNLYDLTGRVALVTGSGVGIGRAIALAIARAGAFVGIHFHESRREAEQTLADVETAGGHGLLLPADLTVEEEAVAVVGRLVRHTSRLDILVNNAGAALSRARIEDCPTELWRRAFDVNVTSAFFVTRQAIPHLRASGRGCIVNNLTLSVQTSSPGSGP